jgi:general stress protein 13
MSDLTQSLFCLGDLVSGKVTKVLPYGAFVDFPNGQSGLLHISEISEKYVQDITSFISVGETLRLRIIAIDSGNNFLKLSLKNLGLEAKESSSTQNKRKRVPVPAEEVNFEPLREKLPGWIAEAIKEKK